MDYRELKIFENAIHKVGSIQRSLIELEAAINEAEDHLSFGDLSADQAYDFEELKRLSYVLNQMIPIVRRMNYLDIDALGRLVKNPNGRYEINGFDYEFTSGHPVEVWVEFDADDVEHFGYPKGRFVPATFLHNGSDYYFDCLGRDVPIEGRMVRIKEVK
jgi:hypothetical protein